MGSACGRSSIFVFLRVSGSEVLLRPLTPRIVDPNQEANQSEQRHPTEQRADGGNPRRQTEPNRQPHTDCTPEVTVRPIDSEKLAASSLQANENLRRYRAPLGRATGLDNEAIDADLARQYGDATP